MKNNIIILLVFLFLLVSCGSRKEIAYFQDSPNLTTQFQDYIPRIQPNDQLAIVISAADINAVAPFNPVSTIQVSASQPNISPYHTTYTVNEIGEIEIPTLGNVKLSGLTRTEAADLLKIKLSKYINNPGVIINFANFRITVLGEVNKPGSFTNPTERITILDAIGMAGDLTIKGKRDNVTVIRELNGVKESHIIDLTSKNTLNSPVYYLAQNDVIYVEPNSAQVAASKFTPNYSLWISMAGVIISVISVLTK